MEIIGIILLIIAIICYYKFKKKKYKKNNKQYNSNNSKFTKESHDESGFKQNYESQKEPHDFSYMPYRKAHLLTKTEHEFFVILVRECIKRKLLVCPKVRLEDIAYVTAKKNRLKYRGYIKSRHIDFVLIDLKCNTVAGVELDDPSHDTLHAAKTDRFKNEVFKTIGVPLIRIKTGLDYISQLSVALDGINYSQHT